MVPRLGTRRLKPVHLLPLRSREKVPARISRSQIQRIPSRARRRPREGHPCLCLCRSVPDFVSRARSPHQHQHQHHYLHHHSRSGTGSSARKEERGEEGEWGAGRGGGDLPGCGGRSVRALDGREEDTDVVEGAGAGTSICEPSISPVLAFSISHFLIHHPITDAFASLCPIYSRSSRCGFLFLFVYVIRYLIH